MEAVRGSSFEFCQPLPLGMDLYCWLFLEKLIKNLTSRMSFFVVDGSFLKMHVFRVFQATWNARGYCPNQVDPKVMPGARREMRDLGNAMRFGAAKKLV